MLLVKSISPSLSLESFLMMACQVVNQAFVGWDYEVWSKGYSMVVFKISFVEDQAILEFIRYRALKPQFQALSSVMLPRNDL